MRFVTGDEARIHALLMAFELFDSADLQELVDGEDAPIEILQECARAVLKRRRMADKAPEN